MLKSLGLIEGPNRFLDGRAQDGSVGLAPFITPPFSGTRWEPQEVATDEITLKCLGEVQGFQFLNGRTDDGSVVLAPSTEGPFTGTRWRVHVEGELVILQCLGERPGVRFLDGRTHDNTVGLSPTTSDPFTGTLWEMSPAPGGVTFKSQGAVEGNRFLDGRTSDGTVGLAPNTDPPFTGTLWGKIDLPNGAIALRSLGAAQSASRMLDGRTHNGSVGLARSTDEPFSGTHWRLAAPSIVMGKPIPDNEDVLAVHAALLPSGKVLYFGGDEHDRKQHDCNKIDHTRTFDSRTFLIHHVPSPTTDVFCCGHASLADGRLLVAGGTEVFQIGNPQELHHDHFPGLHDCWIFDPTTELWTKVTSMASGALEGFRDNSVPGVGDPGGRWYPTLVTLGSGEVLALSGHPGIHDMRHNHHIPERFTVPAPAGDIRGNWTLLSVPTPDFETQGDNNQGGPNVYPRIHLLPNGHVFCSTPLGTTQKCQLIDPTTGSRSFVADAPPDPINRGERNSQSGTSVLLPLLPSGGYGARVLLCGATQPVVIHLEGNISLWQHTASRQLPPSPPRYEASNPPRYNATAILLPTGDVFVCGGTAVSRLDQTPNKPSDATAVMESEIYHPAHDGQPDFWESLPAATVIRNYHSVAVLLPDGRVWTAGSDHNGFQDRVSLEPRIEILNPPYIGQPGRPAIDEAPASVSLGATFTISTGQASDIASVAMLRTGSVTHAYNSDQRYVGLVFFNSGHLLIAVAPPDHNIAPPGFYLLFIIDQEGRPSEGKFVRLL